MRFFGWIVFSLMLAFPALAETGRIHSPFTVEAGAHHNVVLHPLDGTALRLVFPAVGIERPSEDRAILKPAGQGRVALQVMNEGETAFRTGAILHFGQAPLVVERQGDRFAMAGSLKALSLPLIDGPDAGFGTIAFDAMTFKLFLPSTASSAMQDATMSMQATAMRVDPSLLAVALPGEPVHFDAVDLRARATGRMVDSPADLGQLARSVLRVDLDNAAANLSGGRIAASGEIDFNENAALVLDGTLSLGNFPVLLNNLMSDGTFAPEQVFPFALVAGTLGRMTDDGAMMFRVQTTEKGELVLNGRSAKLPMAQ